MKAIIPVAGVGTKLRPHTHTQPKPLIPVAGKPILGHIIDNVMNAGITDITFIVGYLGEKIKNYVETSYEGKVSIDFIVQEPRKGLAHALYFARDLLAAEEEVLIVLGDTIFGEDTTQIVNMEGPVLAVHEVENPREFGIAGLDDDNYVVKLTEKPAIPTSNLALCGMYKITEMNIFLEVLDEMMGSGIGETEEYALTDALMSMVRRGVRFKTYRVENWFDCGRKQSLLHANRVLLGRMDTETLPSYPGTVIVPPVHISPGCTISNSIIGPYVAIAENAVIENSILKNSILGAYSQLDSIILSASVVGNDTSLKGKASSINIGDNTEIDFNQ